MHRLSDRPGWSAWHTGYAVLTCLPVVGLAMVVKKSDEGYCTNRPTW